MFEDSTEPILKLGDCVRVRKSMRSPYGGRLGVIIGIALHDRYGTHLVQFADGMDCRYQVDELEFVRSLTFNGGRLAS